MVKVLISTTIQNYYDKLPEIKKKEFLKALNLVKATKYSPKNIPFFKKLLEKKDFSSFHEYLVRYSTLDIPFKFKTDISRYDEDHRKTEFIKRVWMTPSAYLYFCRQGFRFFTRSKFVEETDKVNKYGRQMLKGSKAPMLVLEYIFSSDGKLVGFNQEGRHRALAAEQLRLKKVPVLILCVSEGLTTNLYKNAAHEHLKNFKHLKEID